MLLNQTDPETGGRFALQFDKCSAALPLRTSGVDIPQGDGSIPGRNWKGGYELRLAINFLEDEGGGFACEGLLRAMWDLFMGHVDALVRPEEADLGSGDARFLWTPSDYGTSALADRMYDRLRLLEWPAPSWEEQLLQAAVAFKTDLPYGMSVTQTTTALDATLTNGGNTPYFPVFKVHGPVSTFTIINETTGYQIGYDAGQPGGTSIGGGEYAEIVTLRDTIYLNGDGANLKPGLFIPNSVFFPLAPGANVLSFTGDGGSCDVLYNDAWA